MNPLRECCETPDLLSLLREDLVGELQAINQYQSHISEITDESTKKVLESIRNEEKVHVGELLTLIESIDPVQHDNLVAGNAEVCTILNELERK